MGELLAALIFGVIIFGFTALMLIPLFFAWLMIGVYREPGTVLGAMPEPPAVEYARARRVGAAVLDPLARALDEPRLDPPRRSPVLPHSADSAHKLRRRRSAFSLGRGRKI